MFTLAAALALLAPTPAAAAAADLHVHLLMDSALPGIFRGEPGEAPAQVRGRRSRRINQVSLKDLEAANVRLVAAALYAPALLSQLRGGYFKTLLKQVAALEKWAARHPRVALVRTPDEAEAVLKSKEWRLGILVAVEGTHGIGTAERLDALWDRGVRLLTIAHFKDGAWGGAAKVRYFPKSTCVPGGKDDGRRSALGLTPLGEKLVARAARKGLLLDLTHSSDLAVKDVVRRHSGLPLLFSHQAARELTPCERMISPDQLREVRRSRGLVGLTFASGYAGKDIPALVAHAKALAREAGPEAVALGSDYNGFISRVAGAEDSRGYAAVLKALAETGIPADKSAEAFVDYWRRTEAYARKIRDD